jgi:hypothetical protein
MLNVFSVLGFQSDNAWRTGFVALFVGQRPGSFQPGALPQAGMKARLWRWADCVQDSMRKRPMQARFLAASGGVRLYFPP